MSTDAWRNQPITPQSSNPFGSSQIQIKNANVERAIRPIHRHIIPCCYTLRKRPRVENVSHYRAVEFAVWDLIVGFGVDDVGCGGYGCGVGVIGE